MRKALWHIMLVMALFLCVTGCHRHGKVIPKSKMVLIYADMFLADQWLISHSDARAVADTTLFYEPIFRRYGYTSKDYDASVSYYIDRPDKFNKVLQKTGKLLNEKYLEYQKIADRLDVAGKANGKDFGYELRDFRNDSTLCLEFLRDTLGIIRDIETTSTDNASRRDSIRTYKEPEVGKLIGHKPAPHPREIM